MADIRDEHGRPIQLTDEFGHPVQLTDEHGNPIHLTGVATTVGSSSTPDDDKGHMTIGSELRNKTTHDQATQTAVDSDKTHFAPTPVDYAKRGAGAVAGAGAAAVGAVAGVGKAATGAVTGGGGPESHTAGKGVAGEEKKQIERSASSSSSSSEDDGQGGRRKKKGFIQKMKEKLPGHSEKEKTTAHSSGTVDNKGSSTTVGGPPDAHEHEKKGFLEKIKDKLPGHH